jgi:hypothetical protein
MHAKWRCSSARPRQSCQVGVSKMGATGLLNAIARRRHDCLNAAAHRGPLRSHWCNGRGNGWTPCFATRGQRSPLASGTRHHPLSVATSASPERALGREKLDRSVVVERSGKPCRKAAAGGRQGGALSAVCGDRAEFEAHRRRRIEDWSCKTRPSPGWGLPPMSSLAASAAPCSARSSFKVAYRHGRASLTRGPARWPPIYSRHGRGATGIASRLGELVPPLPTRRRCPRARSPTWSLEPRAA